MNTVACIGSKICLDISPWTLSVPQSSQFSSSYALGKLFASDLGTDNVRKYPSTFSCQMQAIVYKPMFGTKMTEVKR